ncbi:MAG: NAD(P)H-hydrate dehydratase [Clostridium sp.]|nr:NAD(P)H-hydrate dehydratase [Clostridium sp.]
MQRLATTAQMKELDRAAIQDQGIPSLELMETAAKAVVETVLELLGDRTKIASAVGLIVSGEADTPEEQEELQQLRAIVETKNTEPTARVAIFCGPGNNGGDGIAAARLLRKEGVSVRAFLVGDRRKMTPDANAMEERLIAAGGKLEDYVPGNKGQWAWIATCDCMVDAIFGVGLQRAVEGDFLFAIQQMNGSANAHCPVVACDVPSGVNGDTGEILGDAVRASVTVTFSCAKPGLYLGEGGPCAGQVRVVDIGIPSELISQQIGRQAEVPMVMGWEDCGLPRRPRTAHKGDFGKVFILAGSEGYTGAPVLASKAAVRTGAGLVYLGVPREIYPIAAVKCDEAMPFPLPEDYGSILEKARGCDVALIGPGLGRAPETEELVCRLLADLDIPVVLDADGINALSGHIDVLDRRAAATVLTPHDGEFQRLTGCALPIRDRLAAARTFAKAHRCTLVLKGHGTVTAAPDGRSWINTTGNPGMAKGGSGDVLAGMTAALLGQKHLEGDIPRRSALAVCLHGWAGDACAGELGEYAMTPSDLIEALPRVLREEP